MVSYIAVKNTSVRRGEKKLTDFIYRAFLSKVGDIFVISSCSRWREMRQKHHNGCHGDTLTTQYTPLVRHLKHFFFFFGQTHTSLSPVARYLTSWLMKQLS